MAALYTVGFMVVRLLLTQAMGIFENVWIAGGISALVASVIVAPTLISNLIKGVGSKTGVKVTKDKSCGCDGLVAGFCDLSVAVQARSGGGRGAAQLAVDGGAGDVEQLGELGLGVFAGRVQRQQVLALRGREFGLRAFEFALGSGDANAFAGAQADEVRLKLGHHAEHVEQQPADGIVGVVDAASETERHSLDGELVGGVPRVRERARQPTYGEGSPYGHAIWADACDRVFSTCCIVKFMLTIASRLDVMNRLGRALADPTRSRIILTLLDHPAYPAELARDLDLTRPNVSNHLACLRDCGIVVSEPEGRRTRYEIADSHLAQALTALVDATLAVDEDAPCIDPACSLPGCDAAGEGA